MNEVYRVQQMLKGIVKEEFIPKWMTLPNKAFDGKKPIDVIKEGGIEKIMDMVYRLESGIPS